jgi:hypothetical protein
MNFPDWSTYTFPAWAVSDAAKAWLFGIIFGGLVGVFRASLRWFRRVGQESID